MIFILSHKQNVHDARTEQRTGTSNKMVKRNASARYEVSKEIESDGKRRKGTRERERKRKSEKCTLVYEENGKICYQNSIIIIMPVS